jgi:ParB family chromosome partitioning protein
MSAERPAKGLGMGLSALLGEASRPAPPGEAQGANGVREIEVARIRPNPNQPRTHFDTSALDELAESISERGVLQPILVRPHGDGATYEIIAGERRWRASQMAGLHEVPIVPVDISDSDALEFAIVENVQREDLNPMEEAQGYHALANEFKRSQDDIARVVGKSRSHVANTMRLTKLPAEVQAFIATGELTAGHARALIGVPDPLAAARRIVEEGLNVRQAEALAHEEGVPERKPQKARSTGGKEKDPDTIDLEKRVSDALGLKVTVNHRDPGGSVQINYRNLDQLDEVMKRLAKGAL